MATEKKDVWDKWVSASQVFAAIAIPLALAWGGWRIQAQIAEEGTRSQYVQLALGVLREAPNKENQEEKALRRWSVAVIDKFAPVKLTEESQQFLIAEKFRGANATVYADSVVFSPGVADCSAGAITIDPSRAEECRLQKQLDKYLEDLKKAERALQESKGQKATQGSPTN